MISDILDRSTHSTADTIFFICMIIAICLLFIAIFLLIKEIITPIIIMFLELFVQEKTFTTSTFNVEYIPESTNIILLPINDILIPTPLTTSAHKKISIKINNIPVSFDVPNINTHNKKLIITYKKTFKIHIKTYKFIEIS